jgi:hypothetical protein
LTLQKKGIAKNKISLDSHMARFSDGEKKLNYKKKPVRLAARGVVEFASVVSMVPVRPGLPKKQKVL